jgi:histidinol-phosphate phosphatase family protein
MAADVLDLPEMPALEIAPAVFFDRDGVVNESPGPGYVLRWDSFHFREGIFEALAVARDRGYRTILVTSQKGVGKGFMTDRDLTMIHYRMLERLLEQGVTFDAIYAHTGAPGCPHRPKPDPEMILTAARRHRIDLAESWMVGDADRDIEMGKAAGLKGTIRVAGDKPVGVEADRTVETVAELAGVLREVL